MAVTNCLGFDSGDSSGLSTSVDQITRTGTTAYDTSTIRGGARSIRCNPASGASGYIGILNATGYIHFAINFATLPSVDRVILGDTVVPNLRITSAGTLAYYETTTLIGTGTTVLTTGRWYWLGVRLATGTSVVLIQIDGGNELTATHNTGTTINSKLGFSGTEASAADAYFDDFIVDGAGFLAPSKVALLLPISDSAVGTGWTLGTGTAISGNSGSTAVENTPPQGHADLAAGTDVQQIRNATSNANVNYDANLTTYSTAGILAADTVLAVQQMVSTAAPVTTSSKSGTFGISANPVIANVSLNNAGSAGTFWTGTKAGTYATGWFCSYGAVTTSPSVTLGSSPVARITQVTSNTRIAMVCFMGMYVAWTPAAAAAQVPYLNPMPQLLAQ